MNFYSAAISTYMYSSITARHFNVTSRPVLGAFISTIRILLRVSTIDIGHSLYDIVLTLLCTVYPLPLSGTRTPYGLLTFKTALTKPALEHL